MSTIPHNLKPFLIIGGLFIAVYAAICGAMYMLQRSYIYYPQPAGKAHAFDLSVPGETLKITDHIVPGDKALIYFGGNAESVEWSKPMMQKLFPDRSLYLMNYRGYGGSTGKPTEKWLHSDAAALFAKVSEAHSDIVVMGLSLGTGVAVKLASEKPVSRLVLVTPYDSLMGVAAAVMPRLPVKWLLIDKFESWRYAPKIKAPTTIIIAEKDAVVPAWSGELLATRFAPGVAKVVRFPTAEHHTISNADGFVPAVTN